MTASPGPSVSSAGQPAPGRTPRRLRLPVRQPHRWATVLGGYTGLVALAVPAMGYAWGNVGLALAAFLCAGLLVPLAVLGPVPRTPAERSAAALEPVLRRPRA